MERNMKWAGLYHGSSVFIMGCGLTASSLSLCEPGSFNLKWICYVLICSKTATSLLCTIQYMIIYLKITSEESH